MRWVPLPDSEALAAVMFGSVLLAQVGGDKSLRGIMDGNINEKFVRSQTGRLEFVVEDEQGSQADFIPLFRVQDEQYSVYLDRSGHAAPYRRFTFAADGSAAYEEVTRQSPSP
ncbi:hypothetical protein [Cohnella boryungensis]|uniref:Uncharacterized protein n=1 Tax=Cohnella boryungensis TaxID=768479 RepID=A0ABV8S6Q8_9BACL